MTPPLSPDQLRELRPCPMCGGEAAPNKTTYSALAVRENGWDQDVFHGVNCIRCGLNNIGIVGHKTPEAAAEKWNRRPLEDAQRARIRELEQERTPEEIDVLLLPIMAALHPYAVAHGAVHAKAHRDVDGPAMRADRDKLDATRQTLLASIRDALRKAPLSLVDPDARKEG